MSESPEPTAVTVDGRPAVRFVRYLPHPVEKVWRAITDPDETEKWLPERSEVAEWKVGAEVRLFRDGKEQSQRATIVEYDPPRLLATTFGQNLVRYELEPDGDGCRLTATHVLPKDDQRAMIAVGWEVCLRNLELILDGKEPSTEFGGELAEELNERYSKRFGVDPAVGRRAIEAQRP
jgi:uncharacterized protein YndB with AHSA1/START domain